MKILLISTRSIDDQRHSDFITDFRSGDNISYFAKYNDCLLLSRLVSLSQLATNNGSSSSESHYHQLTDNSAKILLIILSLGNVLWSVDFLIIIRFGMLYLNEIRKRDLLVIPNR